MAALCYIRTASLAPIRYHSTASLAPIRCHSTASLAHIRYHSTASLAPIRYHSTASLAHIHCHSSASLTPIRYHSTASHSTTVNKRKEEPLHHYYFVCIPHPALLFSEDEAKEHVSYVSQKFDGKEIFDGQYFRVSRDASIFAFGERKGTYKLKNKDFSQLPIPQPVKVIMPKRHEKEIYLPKNFLLAEDMCNMLSQAKSISEAFNVCKRMAQVEVQAKSFVFYDKDYTLIHPGEFGMNVIMVEKIRAAIGKDFLVYSAKLPLMGTGDKKTTSVVSRFPGVKPDVIIMHKKAAVGAIIVNSDRFPDEDSPYDSISDAPLVGGVGEFKNMYEDLSLLQLMASFEKLAGELVLRHVANGKSFKYIEMYGLLMSYDGRSEVYKLIMDFSTKHSILFEGNEDGLSAQEGVERLVGTLKENFQFKQEKND